MNMYVSFLFHLNSCFLYPVETVDIFLFLKGIFIYQLERVFINRYINNTIYYISIE